MMPEQLAAGEAYPNCLYHINWERKACVVYWILHVVFQALVASV